MKKRVFVLVKDGKDVATVTVSAPMVVGAEQNLVILGDDDRAVAVIQMEPGTDRRETAGVE